MPTLSIWNRSLHCIKQAWFVCQNIVLTNLQQKSQWCCQGIELHLKLSLSSIGWNISLSKNNTHPWDIQIRDLHFLVTMFETICQLRCKSSLCALWHSCQTDTDGTQNLLEERNCLKNLEVLSSSKELGKRLPWNTGLLLRKLWVVVCFHSRHLTICKHSCVRHISWAFRSAISSKQTLFTNHKASAMEA